VAYGKPFVERVDELCPVMAMLLNRVPWCVASFSELAAQLGYERMAYRLPVFVGLEVALGDIGCVLGVIDEHVVPRHALRRARPRHGVVPLVGTLERGIDIEHDASVPVELVMDDLAHEELGYVIHAISIADSEPC
jgi:hypothetical protein